MAFYYDETTTPVGLFAFEPLFKGRAFTIRRDRLKTSDGRGTRLEIREHDG